jgi:hypothetical protein
VTLKARWHMVLAVELLSIGACLVLYVLLPRVLGLLSVSLVGMMLLLFRRRAMRCPSCGRPTWLGDRDRLRWPFPLGTPTKCRYCGARLG